MLSICWPIDGEPQVSSLHLACGIFTAFHFHRFPFQLRSCGFFPFQFLRLARDFLGYVCCLRGVCALYLHTFAVSSLFVCVCKLRIRRVLFSTLLTQLAGCAPASEPTAESICPAYLHNKQRVAPAFHRPHGSQFVCHSACHLINMCIACS